MDPRAQNHLIDRLEGARRMTELGGAFHTGDARRSTFASYGGALEAFRAMGAISDDERQDWTNRMLVALGLEPLEPLPPAGPNMVVARSVFVGAPGEVPPVVEPPQPAGSLVRAIVVPGASWEFADGRFQILSVEVYEHAVSVTWREHPLIKPELAHADELQIAVRDLEGLSDAEREMRRQGILRRLDHRSLIEGIEDDVGTTYRGTSGGSGGGMDTRRGHQDFAPGPPPAATRLVVHWHGQHVEVPL
jgi:hypothetical protein